MAPRLPVNANNRLQIRRSLEDLADCAAAGFSHGKQLPDFNWQKAMIQSRIMEKVQNVGDRINSQSRWLEQMRTLAKERSITSLFIALVGLFLVVPIFVCLLALAFTFFGFVFVEVGTLLTIACCLLGGLLVVAACFSLPLILVLFITYTLSSLAFNLFSSTSSKIKQIKHMVVPVPPPNASPPRSPIAGQVLLATPPGKTCTDGSAFLPACITESDCFLEATVLRRAQMSGRKTMTEKQF